MVTAQLSFQTLLEDARAEALAVLRELLFPSPEDPPSLLRERRMAATAILKIQPEAQPDSAEQPPAHTPSTSEGADATKPAQTEPRREVPPDRAETRHSQTPPISVTREQPAPAEPRERNPARSTGYGGP